MNTLQSFWNFFLNTSLLDNTLDVTNEKKKGFFLLCVVDWGYCSCKRDFSCSCCSTYNCLYFLMLLTEAFLCDQNYTSRYGNYNISPWQERKALKSPTFSPVSLRTKTACSDLRSRGPTSIRRGTPWKREMIDTFRNQRRLIARAWTNCGFTYLQFPMIKFPSWRIIIPVVAFGSHSSGFEPLL